MGEKWKGGDVGRSIGGGQKVRLLKEAMDTLEVGEDQVILSVDRYGFQHCLLGILPRITAARPFINLIKEMFPFFHSCLYFQQPALTTLLI